MIVSDSCHDHDEIVHVEQSPEVFIDHPVTEDAENLEEPVEEFEVYGETVVSSNMCELDTSLDEEHCFANLSASYVHSDEDLESYDSCNSHLSDSSFTSDESSSNSSSSCESEDDNGSKLTAQESQALHILSCFSRNNLSASACKDILETMKSLFPNSEVASLLNLNHLLTYVDTTPVREVHYCILCDELFPSDPDVVLCATVNCEGLRYKGSRQNQQQKGRQPRKSFVMADIKKQLEDLLQTPGKKSLETNFQTEKI